jgi:hypothetical protein
LKNQADETSPVQALCLRTAVDNDQGMIAHFASALRNLDCAGQARSDYQFDRVN